ncbi:MAG: hypothetical protein SCK57_03970 [Bacillota bacterium]|nr:hypothetical protein [Bacillota bacterium]MDW7676796.1 hypothetical protein [Bacillota bacterium]
MALRATSFKEQPFSDRTFNRFRKRFYQHELETGEDLLKDEMEAPAETFEKMDRQEEKTTLDEVQALFVLDTDHKKVIKCPAGQKPYKTRFDEKPGTYRASFSRGTCDDCPLRDRCGVKFLKKFAYVMVSEKMVTRAAYLQKMSSYDRQKTGSPQKTLLERRIKALELAGRAIEQSDLLFVHSEWGEIS